MNSTNLVHELLERAAQRRPEDVFVVHEDTRASYGEIEAGANRLAHVLADEGVERGDRVGLLARNTRFYVEAYYGILKAGGIAVPLNTAADGSGLATFLDRCGARVLLAGAGFERACRAAVSAGAALDVLGVPDADRLRERPNGLRCLSLSERCADAPPEPPRHPIRASDVASIVFTSGSTGTPDGATLSHANLVANTESIVSYLELTAADRILAVLPFYYVYGKSLLNTHAAAGARVVIENRFQYPNVALDTLENEGCTGFSGVPSTFAILLDRSNLAERQLETLRYVTQAGGAMSPALTRRLMDALPHQSIFVMYGATEASARLAYLPPADLPRRIGSIGRAIPGVELRVLRRDGSECDVDEVGEIVARGPNIMQGYWGDPEGTARVLDEDGYHTGDLARRDAEGFLFVVGRSSDFIKSGAHRVSAVEIEQALGELDDIRETAVVGVSDELLGERIVAFVVAREGSEPDPRAILKALKRRLPVYKLPREVRLVPDLPRNESGKIMKRELVEGD